LSLEVFTFPFVFTPDFTRLSQLPHLQIWYEVMIKTLFGSIVRRILKLIILCRVWNRTSRLTLRVILAHVRFRV
jgi:hypothetical protein